MEASAFAQERKQELMKNHFDFGSPTLLRTGQPLQSSSKGFFSNPNASPAPKHPNMASIAGVLKHKSFNVLNGGPTAQPGASFFASNTATSYKWVQPQFV